MNLCSNGHDEICYESRKCPLCENIHEMEELQKILEGHEKEEDHLNQLVDDLTERLENAVELCPEAFV